MKNNQNYTLTYIGLSRVLYVVYYFLIMCSIGGIFVLLMENWFAKLLGFLITLFLLLTVLNAIFFKSIEIYEKKLVFNWYCFNSEIIDNQDLFVMLKQGIGWGGLFSIKNKQKPIKSWLFMNISIFPLDYEHLDDIRKMFIDKNLDVGKDDDCWPYKIFA